VWRWFAWPVLVLVSLLLTVVTAIGAPLWVSLADASGNVPVWLSWLQTSDNTLDGDAPWQDPAVHPWMCRLPPFWKRVCWMWRNPGGGFDIGPAGATIDQCIRWRGNPDTSNQGGSGGVCVAWASQAWMVYIVIPYGSHCFRAYLGWKLMDAVHDSNFTGRLPLVFSINPFMGYTPK